MSLRFALLAVLSAEPMTGYDLMRFFDDSVAFIWHAPHTNIYPELRRMEADGLLEAEELPRGKRGTKRLYRITEHGFDFLRQQTRKVVEPTRERDPYRLQAAYFEWADPEAVREQLRLHLEHFTRWRTAWEEHIEQLHARRVRLLHERLAHAPAEDHEAIVAFKVFAYRGMAERARMEIEWAQLGLELVDRLELSGWRGGQPAAGTGGSRAEAGVDLP
ncbi:MAG TPA: PadR family transcriptional regulator [Solirubrobacteraceae bacterium]|jgi:DNA-binding PadR family transcriptional regulator|nr:PadR family transcriptional regulator [Solirubrobacteraceae bacterium]